MKTNQLKFTLKNDLDQLKMLCRKIEAFGAAIGLPEKAIFELNLVLDELFTNAVSYGFCSKSEQWISYFCTYEDRTITIRIEDSGTPFNPLNAKRPDTKCSMEKRKIGGIGILLVKRFVDDICYEQCEGRNILTLKKRINPDVE